MNPFVAWYIVGSSFFTMGVVAKTLYDPRMRIAMFVWEQYFKFIQGLRRE